MSKQPFLSKDQVYELNVKHGYFEYSDAQGDVSRQFAQDAIAMHERMRAAAPELFAVVTKLLEIANLSNPEDLQKEIEALSREAADAWDLASSPPL